MQAVIDLTATEGFQWDSGNFRKSADMQLGSQSEAELVFFNQPLLLLSDHRHSQEKIRLRALGRTDDHRLLHITFTLRGGRRLSWVISAPPQGKAAL